MGFSSRNQFSEKERVVTSRMKAASKKSNSFDQSKHETGVKIPGKDQLVHQKNTKIFASQKMSKFTKNNQKIEDGTGIGYTQQTKKASPKKQVTSREARLDSSKLRKNLRVKEARLDSPKMQAASKGGDCSKLRKNLRVKEARLDSPKKQAALKGGDCSKLRKNLRVKEARLDSPKKQAALKGGDCSKLRKNQRVKEARFDRVHQKKPAAVYPEPEPEPKGINVEDQLSLFDRLSEDSDCMWLSSDCFPSSFLRSNASQDTWELDCLDQFLQRQLTSLSSSSGNSTSLDEDKESVDAVRSKSCPVNETCLVLGRQSGCGEKDVKELLPPESFGIKRQECSVRSPDSYLSGYNSIRELNSC